MEDLLSFTSLPKSPLFITPPPSSIRISRSINLEKFWDCPYNNNKLALFDEAKLSLHQVRELEQIQHQRARPITSRSAKVRGTEGIITTTTIDSSDITNADEIKRSLIVIGQKSTTSNSKYVDPELLWTKAPGFLAGITMTKTVADLEIEKEKKRKKEAEKRALLLDEEEEADIQKQESTAKEEEENSPVSYPFELEDNNTKPNTKIKKQKDEYSKLASQPWSIVDNSDTSDFYKHVPQLAIQYPFELDAFQKRAVNHLEKGESVFVAAHTSAGKTVVAEYAIALAFENRTRLVYTSPIKALSNQKYRDFSEKFGADKVGLLTGDNSVNPDAPCVIMTTEILRSMLYRGAEMIRDVEFVVFDEVHYISDPERGVIWEEVVIMLPLHVHVVMLSATTPNTEEFSAWVGRNRREQVFVVSTEKRPVPLEHYLYCDGEMFKIMDSSNRFNSDAHTAAVKSKRAKDPFAELPGKNDKNVPKRGEQRQAARHWAYSSGSHSKNEKTGENRWLDLVKDLNKKKLLPVIIFTFSKKMVESRAAALMKIDLLAAKEKSQTHVILHRALSRLQEGDRNLPQIRRVGLLLSKGIGVHHGGLLPILKEVVEICFTNGLVRVLIATETFAMGVNAPCRTVVFGGLRKHDGNEFRDLSSGEYIQMCGRAGRRGLDTVGTVIIHCEDDVPPLDNLARMLSGRSSKLDSRFRLRYAMMLNLLRTDNLSVSDMMRRSFSEFSRSNTTGGKTIRMKQLRKSLKEAEYNAFNQFPCIRANEGASVNDIEDYHIEMVRLDRKVSTYVGDMLSGGLGKSKNEILKPGRIIVISLNDLKLYSIFGVVIQETHSLIKASDDDNEQYYNEERFVVVAQLSRDYIFPINCARLADTINNSKDLESNIGKRRKDHDDDDFFSGKKKSVQRKAPVFFERDNNNISNKSIASSKTDALPRATFGNFQTNEEVDDEMKSTKVVVLRISLNEIERVSALCLDQSTVSREITERITFGRSEKDTSFIIQNLIKKLTIVNYKLPKLNLRDLKVDSMSDVYNWEKNENDRELIQTSLCHTCIVRDQHRSLVKIVTDIKKDLKQLQTETSDETLTLFPDFVARLELLRKLKYISHDEDDDEDCVELKGRVACEINTCDELLLAEMIFENVFDPLDAAECVALLSSLVLQGKCENEVEAPTTNLGIAVEKTLQIASFLQNEQEHFGVRLDSSDDWVESVLNPGLLLVAYEWARGRPFSALTDMTSLEEGIIVRAITRLDETCREVKNIARVIGDPILLQKMELASSSIKRDIIFATSLYVA